MGGAGPLGPNKTLGSFPAKSDTDPATMCCPRTLRKAFRFVGGCLELVGATATLGSSDAVACQRCPAHKAPRQGSSGVLPETSRTVPTRLARLLAGIGCEAVEVQDHGCVGVEILDGEVHPCRAGHESLSVFQAQRHSAELIPQGSPSVGVQRGVPWREQQREPARTSGAESEADAVRSCVAHDGTYLQGRIRPRAVGLESEGVGALRRIGHVGLST